MISQNDKQGNEYKNFMLNWIQQKTVSLMEDCMCLLYERHSFYLVLTLLLDWNAWQVMDQEDLCIHDTHNDDSEY